jgi:5-methylcytosine-specific restriction protein B
MSQYSSECLAILNQLKTRKNVLMMGPPACGKTTLLSEIADAFKNGYLANQRPIQPTHVTGTPVTIPRTIPDGSGATPLSQLPSPNRSTRNVFQAVFNANSKPRDFLTGLIPNISKGSDSIGFKVTTGKLVQANQFAMQPNGAALLIIDELNRGPAVQLFGDAIVAIEVDKRLAEDDSQPSTAWPFDILNPTSGEMNPMYLSAHLYILAAMNQADVSVEPLDVAFIRRWERYALTPSSEKVRRMLGATGTTNELPATPGTPGDVIEAAVRAWESVNERIALGRGAEFMLGHGVFLSRSITTLPTIQDALEIAVACWASIIAHLEEVFFGDAFGIAATLRADMSSGHYQLLSVPFGQEQRQVLKRPAKIDNDNIYSLLVWVGRK